VGGVLLRERFRTIDTTRWIVLGRPAARIVERGGERVLSLPGDEKYLDGLLGRFPVPLARGATVEMEFRLRPTRNVFQKIALCLADADPGSVDATVGQAAIRRRAACFVYPAEILARFDPRNVALGVSPGYLTVVDVPEVLPTDDWVHVALQVRADGDVSLYLDHAFVARSPVRLPTEPLSQWVVFLDGEAVGTEVLVRNLAVWPEPRY